MTINKYDVTASDWQNVSGYSDCVFALCLDGTPEYFFVKTASNTGNTNQIFLFQNLDSYNYAVINLVDMGFSNIINIGKVSHIGEVPEAGTIMLLGIGLVGLAVYGRKRMKN